MPSQRTSSVGPSAPTSSRLDVLLFLVASGLLLSFIWRLQNLFTPWGVIQGPSLMAAAGLLLLFVGGRHRLVLARARHPVGVATLVILLTVFVSIPWSLYPGLSFGFLFGDFLKTLLMMAVVLAAIRHGGHLEKVALMTVAGAGLYSLYILSNFQLGTSGRLGKLIYYDANDLALWLVVTMPLAAHLVFRPPFRFARMVGLVCLGMILTVFAQTGSRGGFIGFVAVACYMVLGYRQFPLAKRIGVAAALFFGLSLVASEAYWDLMATLLDPTSDYNWTGNAQGGGRMNIWRRGIGYMLSDPLTGVGARAFPVAEGTVSEFAARQQFGIGWKWSAAHNSFVQIGAELGVIGLISFTAAIGIAFRRLARIARRASDPSTVSMARALSAALVGYVAAGFFVSQAYGAYLYLLLGMVIALDASLRAGAASWRNGRPPRRGAAPLRGARRGGVLAPGPAGAVSPRAHGAAAGTGSVGAVI